MIKRVVFSLFVFSSLLYCGCKKKAESNFYDDHKLFEHESSELTFITFQNIITETDTLNYFNYPYLYMGGGVAIGDIDNDGLQDIFFTGNMIESRLYRNLGDLKFEDITEESGINNNKQWSTGATMVDINLDGYLDIYVSVSGKHNKANKFYINNTDLTFTESAAKYGLNHRGSTTQSVFFDYDNDNDLDVYVANYPVAKFGSSNAFYKKKMQNLTDEESDKLYRNDGNGLFTDVSVSSGIANYGLSLGLSAADFNNDGWIDVYVSNDFSTPDYLWMNNGDGTFSNRLRDSFGHTAFYAMGCDAADFNNDGWIDLIQVDMTPEDNRRSKSNMASMNPEYFRNTVQSGFHYQYMQNCLQLNRGNIADDHNYFSDISRLSGTATTDWSWGPLLADLDNDGWKDVFITNGTKRDVNNRDFFNDLQLKVNFTRQAPVNSLEIPSEPVENYAYRNNGDLSFSDAGLDWGLNFKGFSNGASYADLDNDGDLDLVVNNIDAEASVYRNRSSESGKGNYFRLKFDGPKGNAFGIGTKVWLYQGEFTQFQQLMLTRGFQSSVEPILHFGLPISDKIDSVVVSWPDGTQQKMMNVTSNGLMVVKYESGKKIRMKTKESRQGLFKDVTHESTLIYKHLENQFDDSQKEPLLPYQYSRLGPGLAVGDTNGDGLDDFFIGNATGQSGSLFIQTKNGKFGELDGPWKEQMKFEDVTGPFF